MRNTLKKAVALLLVSACVSASIPSFAYEDATELSGETMTEAVEAVEADSAGEDTAAGEADDSALTDTESQAANSAQTDAALQSDDSVQTDAESQPEASVQPEDSSQTDDSSQSNDSIQLASSAEDNTEESIQEASVEADTEMEAQLTASAQTDETELSDDSSAEDETVFRFEMSLEDDSESGLEDNVKRVRITGTGTGEEVRMYFWDYDADDVFSDNMDEWRMYLTDPLESVTIDGLYENLLEIPITLIDGTASSINAVYIQEANGEEITGRYLSFPLPEGASFDTCIDLIRNSEDENTVLFIEACVVESGEQPSSVSGLAVRWITDEASEEMLLAVSLDDMASETEEDETESEISQEATEESDDNILSSSVDPDAIDVTYLVTGEGTSHDCNMYKTDTYNEEGHWTECSICGKRYDSAAGAFVEDDSIIEEHTLVTTGSGLCGTYTISYCTECGYSDSVYIAHQPVEDGSLWTNPVTYYHAIGSCSVCGNISDGAYLLENCYDSDGNPITCTNRKVCAGCGYDYTTHIVSHHSVCTDDGITYYCEYCGKEIYKLLTQWDVHDADDPLHYTFYGIFYLCDGVSFAGDEGGDTYAGGDNNTGAVTLTDASHSSLPSEYYNNSDYNTAGYTSGLYLVQYEAFIADGYQGVINYVRLNCDNWFSVEPSGTMPEYAKTYAMKFENLTPDVEAPADLTASVQKSTIVSGYYTQMTLTVTCTDKYSDSVEVGVFDSEGNELIGYCEAMYNGSEFVYTFNISSAEIEAQEDQDVFVYYKDRFGNISKKELTLNKYDTKAPVYDESNSSTDTEWSRTKTYVATATDYGVGGVQIAFNSEDDYEAADVSGNTYTREFALTGDVYGSVIAAVYYQDALGNKRTQFITIYNLDNTAPTITDVTVTVNESENAAILEATANDYSTTLEKEGSGVTAYALSSSASIIDGSWQDDNTFTVYNDGIYYIWAMDGVGLMSVSSEVVVTGLTYDVSVSKTVSDASGLYGNDLSGFVFTLYGTSGSGDTFSGEAVTDSLGLAEFTGVPTGVYTLTETAAPGGTEETPIPEWWDTAKDQEVTVAYGETLSFEAENTYKTGSIQINKNAETQSASEFNVNDSSYNDTLAGFAFLLSGTGSAGEEAEMYAVTGDDGIAMFTDLPVGTEYTVTELSKEEVQAAAENGSSAAGQILDSVTQSLVQYVAVDPFTVKSEYDSTTNYTVMNYLKLFRITVTQVDAALLEKGAAQDYATMEGAVYGLYHDGQLIAEYTTDAEGTFITDYVPCGDNWYIQQITPSIGYQPNNTQYDIEASPALFTERYNEAHLNISTQSGSTNPDSDPDSEADPDSNPDPEPEDVIYVSPYTGSVSIKKYDGNGKALSGVSFELTDSDGNAVTGADGTLCTAMTTGTDGSVTSCSLFPGDYQAVETDTVSGQSLLAEPFQVTLPLILTEDEAEEYGKKLDLSKAVAYTSAEGSVSYYFYNLTYEVTNSGTFAIPTTGGTGENAIPLLSGCTMLTFGLILLWKRKYRYIFG